MKTNLFRIVILLLPTAIFANAADSFGFGAKGTGMSGVGTAMVNDWTAPYFNIAGLAFPDPDTARLRKRKENADDSASGKIRILKTKEEQLQEVDEEGDYETEVGFNYLYQISSMTISPVSTNSQVENNIGIATEGANFGFIQLGLVFDLRNWFFIPQRLPVKFGIAMSLRDNGNIAAVNDVSAESYNFLRLNRESQRIMIMSGLGFQVWKDRLSLGAGTSILAGGDGRFRMDNVIIDPSGNEQIPAQEVILNLTPRIAPTAGVQYRHALKDLISAPWAAQGTLYTGISWRGELYMELDPLVASATTQLLAIDLPIRLSVLEFYTPHIFSWGLGYMHSDWLKAELDLEMQLWSGYKLSSAKITYYARQNISIPEFENIFVPRFGAAIRPGEFISALAEVPLWTRFGYALVPAFTPDQAGVTNFLDNTKHLISLGAGYTLPANKVVKVPVELNLGLQMQLWGSRESTKAAVNSFNPSYSYSASIFIVSLSASMKF